MVLLAVVLLCPAIDVRADPNPIVEAVQEALAERGFDPGPVDGALGSRTRGAIARFQASIGLPDHGRIDDATLAALGVDAPTESPAVETAQFGRAPVETPQARAPGAEPAVETAQSGPAPMQTPQARAPGAEPAVETAQFEPEPVQTPPAPAPVAAPEPVRRLSFATLGWHPPQSGADALARFVASGTPTELTRGRGALFVPASDLVFVLEEGERVPGFDCDPRDTTLSVEFAFGPDGPVIFTPLAQGEYCQMGIGIMLAVGSRLQMRRVDWGDTQHPPGTVRVTDRGLEYVR